MTVRQQHQSTIARTVAAELARGLQEPLDLVRYQILAFAPRSVGLASRGEGEPGVPADRGSEAFLLRRRAATFPFRSFGPGKGEGTLLGGKAISEYRTFP